LRGGDALQRAARIGRFIRDALAVDQDIFGRRAQAAIAAIGAGDDQEPRYFFDHVERRARRESRKVYLRVALAAVAGLRDCGRGVARRQLGALCKRKFRYEHPHSDRQR